jgi:hypothetical protein
MRFGVFVPQGSRLDLVGIEPAQQMADAEGPLVGTPEQIIQRLSELDALGMTYAITYFADAAYDRSSIELFAREVIPALT